MRAEQTDLDDALLRSAGAALAPDWLVHRAGRTLAIPAVDVAKLGVTVPRGMRAIPAELLPRLRTAAGLCGQSPMPAVGLNAVLTATEVEE